MILDLSRFLATARPGWDELAALLKRLEDNPDRRLSLADAQRLHELYERAASDLARLATFAYEPDLRVRLEALVARAYAEIHAGSDEQLRLPARTWLTRTLPQTFRRHVRMFGWVCAITLAGMLVGVLLMAFDPAARETLLPFGHDRIHPSERVAHEEHGHLDPGRHATAFSAYLITHNCRVAFFCLALGMTWGVGTFVMLFFNGVIMGAIVFDYMMAGQTPFLLGWLLPHGVVEIPAILVAGQAGLLLARALLPASGQGRLGDRFRAVRGDLATLIGGIVLLLIWAGIVEAFFSQYHEPVLPYAAKIGFGLTEFALLTLYASRAGRASAEESVP